MRTLLLYFLLVCLPVLVSAQHKWKQNDTLFVMYPYGSHFYKQPDMNSDKFFTFIRSTKVVLLDTRPMSPLMQVHGAWGYLKLVQWEGYKGYIFDGFLTSMYVCKTEVCDNIVNAFDWYNVREYSIESPYDCAASARGKIPDSLCLSLVCDSVDIRWRNGVLYKHQHTPRKITETYSIPSVSVQEVFLWTKLIYEELIDASIYQPRYTLEDIKGNKIIRQQHKYDYDINQRINFFSAKYKVHNQANNELLYDFSFSIEQNAKLGVLIRVEKNLYGILYEDTPNTQLIIKEK
jgi:hypothetical protein